MFQRLLRPKKGNNILDSPADLGENPLEGSPDSAIPPLRAEPYRLASLAEIMQWLNFSGYLMMTEIMGVGYLMPPEIEVPEAMRGQVSRSFTPFLNDCVSLSLDASAASVRKILALVNDTQRPIYMGGLISLWVEFHGRFVDETQSLRFFSMTPQEAEEYNEPWRGWEAVTEGFPHSYRDVYEASRCLAVARYTAVVFHLMRVMEIGLRFLGEALNDESLDPSRNPSWDNILKKCEKELQKPIKDRSPEWHADERFFATATANLRAVQYAWRNPTLHVENHYGEEEAREIYRAVRGFMRHLATKLGEQS